jgi:predicted Zn finger-like uncharacterized protein
MIATCPSCLTRQNLASQRLPSGKTMLRCGECDHSWIESRALAVVDVEPVPVPASTIVDVSPATDREIGRLIEATKAAQEEFARIRAKKRAKLRGWAILAACMLAPVAAAAAFPEPIVKVAPYAAKLYAKVGFKVNVYGLEFRKIEEQHLIVDGTRVIAIKGEIVNISSKDRKIPAIRFSLRDAAMKEVYAWTVDSATRPLRPGEITSFSTRVASPPQSAKDLEIRFARRSEIVSNTAP